MAAELREAFDQLRQLVASFQVDEGSHFFNRVREMQEILNVVQDVNRIIVLIGPTNSGKSALLLHLHTLWEAHPKLKAHLPIFHIDLRKADFRTPELAAKALSQQMKTWSTWFVDFLKSVGKVLKFTVKGVSVDFSGFLGLFADQSKDFDLAFVMTRLNELAFNNPYFRPVIIIDEADRLKLWRDEEVQTLMGGLIAMTKQENKAAVLMSTSDDLFRLWFKQHANAPQWTAIGVGHFSEDNARGFLRRLLRKYYDGAGKVPDNWPEQKIYEVCGGCPLLLQNCVKDVFQRGKDIEVVLQGMVEAESSSIELGLVGGEGWEGDKFKQIIELIVTHVAVGLETVLRTCFEGSRSECHRQITSMLANNLIHIRYAPADVKYDDFDRAGSKSKKFVMAKNPAHYRAMKMFLEDELVP